VTNATDERAPSFIQDAIEFLAKADDNYVGGYGCAEAKTEADNSDLTATLQPFPGLSLLASRAHIDAAITQDAILPAAIALRAYRRFQDGFGRTTKSPMAASGM
jgi:hypothetical protein